MYKKDCKNNSAKTAYIEKTNKYGSFKEEINTIIPI